eukprot:4768723-Pyramimonas_sp.AAC.1
MPPSVHDEAPQRVICQGVEHCCNIGVLAIAKPLRPNTRADLTQRRQLAKNDLQGLVPPLREVSREAIQNTPV